MKPSFHDKVVLVTGASSGIGEAAVALFADAGATVYGTARGESQLELMRARHPGVRWVRADVTDAAGIKAAVEAIVREAGRLDVLVNNAAIFEFASLEAVSVDSIRGQFATNVHGSIFAAQAALPALKATRGAILNISSAAGHKPVPGARSTARPRPRSSRSPDPGRSSSPLTACA